MAKGNIAKAAIANKLQEVFGNDYAGEQDKKYYIWADDGGEKVQIAISMTCPKSPIGDMPSAISETPKLEDFTPEEEANIQRLKEKLRF